MTGASCKEKRCMNYETIIRENQQWIDEIWDKLDEKLSYTALRSYDKIP